MSTLPIAYALVLKRVVFAAVVSALINRLCWQLKNQKYSVTLIMLLYKLGKIFEK